MKAAFVREDFLQIPSSLRVSTSTHYLDILTRSMSTRAVSGDLTDRHQRVIPSAFWAYFRWYFNLPPTTTDILVAHPGYDYAVTLCKATACRQSEVEQVVDAQGNHAVACEGSKYGPTCNTHSMLKAVVAHAAKKLGLATIDEPSTFKLLLGQYSVEQLRVMFPKYQSKLAKQQSERLHEIFMLIESMEVSPERLALSAEADRIVQSAPDETSNKKKKGLRVDVAIIGGMQPIWVDVTSIQSTCKSHVAAQYNWHKREQQAGVIATYRKAENSFYRQPSAAVNKKILEKTSKYQPLMNLAQLQHARHRRATMPRFQVCVLSHHCEFSGGFFELFDWFAGQFRQQQHAIFNYEGIPLAKRVSAFQSRLYNRGTACMIGGWGLHLTMMGQQCY
jgi:hypothetical protein